MSKRSLLVATVIVTLAACSSETVKIEEAVEVKITAGLENVATRANGTNWDKDVIGVSVIQASNETVASKTNIKYTTTSTSDVANFVAGDDAITLPSGFEGSATFAAYDPYGTPTDGLIAINTKDNNATTAAQKTIDYLFATGATASIASPYVVFKGEQAFKHKMVRLVLEIKGASGASKVTLGGLKHTGSFNIKTGAITASGDAVSGWELPLPTSDSQVYTLILVPQTLASALPLAITINNVTYKNNSSLSPDLSIAGNSYSYDITVKKITETPGEGETIDSGLEVSGCTISDWNTVSNGSGEAHL